MPTLLFVYNADSGLFSTLADIAHKVFSPETYACNLCALTHAPLGMRKEWKTFLDGLGLPLEFLHRDEFQQHYGLKDVALPAIFAKRPQERLEPLVDARTINEARSIDELKRVLAERIRQP